MVGTVENKADTETTLKRTYNQQIEGHVYLNNHNIQKPTRRCKCMKQAECKATSNEEEDIILYFRRKNEKREDTECEERRKKKRGVVGRRVQRERRKRKKGKDQDCASRSSRIPTLGGYAEVGRGRPL